MNLYGIAILPDNKCSTEIINFQNNNLDYFVGPKLSLDGYLPHTSILQCPFLPEKLTGKLLDDITDDWIKPPNFQSTLGDIYESPIGWLFLDVDKTPWLKSLQITALNMTKDFIDAQQIARSQNIDAHTDEERYNFLKYGYRYIGNCFKPHITLGYLGHSPNYIIDSPFMNEAITYDKIVLYRAGQDGALKKILHEKQLR